MVAEIEPLEFTKNKIILNGNKHMEIIYCSFYFY